MGIGSMTVSDIEAMVEKGKELQKLLQETPGIIRFMELMKELGDSAAILPAKADRLIRAGEAAQILGVDKNTIYRFAKEGRLTVLYTAGSNQKKFWLSDIIRLPERRDEGRNTCMDKISDQKEGEA